MKALLIAVVLLARLRSAHRLTLTGWTQTGGLLMPFLQSVSNSLASSLARVRRCRHLPTASIFVATLAGAFLASGPVQPAFGQFSVMARSATFSISIGQQPCDPGTGGDRGLQRGTGSISQNLEVSGSVEFPATCAPACMAAATLSSTIAPGSLLFEGNANIYTGAPFPVNGYASVSSAFFEDVVEFAVCQPTLVQFDRELHGWGLGQIGLFVGYYGGSIVTQDGPVSLINFMFDNNNSDLDSTQEVTLLPGSYILRRMVSFSSWSYREDALRSRSGSVRVGLTALTGGFGISSQPVGVTTCPSGSASFSVTAVDTGPITYRWQYLDPGTAAWNYAADGPLVSTNGLVLATLAGASTPNMTLSLTRGYAHEFVDWRCVVSSSTCGFVISSPASLTVCAADFNCDGAVDFFDYDDFVTAFEAGDASADFDQDGTLDFFDYDGFVRAFETPC